MTAYSHGLVHANQSCMMEKFSWIRSMDQLTNLQCIHLQTLSDTDESILTVNMLVVATDFQYFYF